VTHRRGAEDAERRQKVGLEREMLGIKQRLMRLQGESAKIVLLAMFRWTCAAQVGDAILVDVVIHTV
jgi:hypothetical protein